MKGIVIRLESVVVVPVMNEGNGHWKCVVVHSDHPSYPVGGYDVSIPTEELSRGQVIKL